MEDLAEHGRDTGIHSSRRFCHEDCLSLSLEARRAQLQLSLLFTDTRSVFIDKGRQKGSRCFLDFLAWPCPPRLDTLRSMPTRLISRQSRS